MKKVWSSVLVVFGVLLIDQWIKLWIKLNMTLGQEFLVFGEWFRIHFIENNGMAFGMEFGGDYGKIILTLFRIIAVGGIVWYIRYLIKSKASMGLIICISMILAGAIGNILDSLFYGMLFTESRYHLVSQFNPGNGYSSLLQGKVVDMLYFPIIDTQYPSWFPSHAPTWLPSGFARKIPLAGEQFLFFRPVFNIADSSITLGVSFLMIFQRRFFKGL